MVETLQALKPLADLLNLWAYLAPLFIMLILAKVMKIKDNSDKIVERLDFIFAELKSERLEANQEKTRLISKKTSYTSTIKPEDYFVKKQPDKEKEGGL